MELDFLKVKIKHTRSGIVVYPTFVTYPKSKQLMIRSQEFYAIYDEKTGFWSTNHDLVLELMDSKLREVASKYDDGDTPVVVKYLSDSDHGSIDDWNHYCAKQAKDNFIPLDETIKFANDTIDRESYASKQLSYPLIPGDCSAWDKLVGTLYAEKERHKIEWCIGAIVTGASTSLQKFMVLYGRGGTGKSTIINIVEMLFEGYTAVFDAKALGSNSNQFALEPFKANPLVAIEHDGDLSRIEDNTRINSLVSHELMSVNQKFKALYSQRFKAFLIMGTNKPVKITDAKSGIIRRLIDVQPSGNLLPRHEYDALFKMIPFQLSGIAWHCKEVFEADPYFYDSYTPTLMLGATNDFYGFMLEIYDKVKAEDGITLKNAWELYKNYIEDSKIQNSLNLRVFRNELMNYFSEFDERYQKNGVALRSYYHGFKTERFDRYGKDFTINTDTPIQNEFMVFKEQHSPLDDFLSDCPAQYSNGKCPIMEWAKNEKRLKDINTNIEHFVQVPTNHIFIDFDLRDENGNKSLSKNIEAASKWPYTYAELSKSGEGIHLHYNYVGDTSKLSAIYAPNIEIKVQTGNSALRRRVTKNNGMSISDISSGLPLKEEKKVVIDNEIIITERNIRSRIAKNLHKEYHSSTKSSIDFIKKILDDAYTSGIEYDVMNMKGDIIAFAAQSTHNARYCINLCNQMHFCSENASKYVPQDEKPIVFFDIEIFPNLFVVNYKISGPENPVIRLINPEPYQLEHLFKYNLVGFNNRPYDNHMLYARYIGYSIYDLYLLSQRIIQNDKNAMFREAYNLSYTDVYDFSAKKQSLKKWEIELGLKHHELGIPWDQPVPEDLWEKVAEYCDDDVLATEALYYHLGGDFAARKIQCEIIKHLYNINANVNETTNALSQKIIFGSNKNPQNEFNWRDMSKPVGVDRLDEYKRKFGDNYIFRLFDENGLPTYKKVSDYNNISDINANWSILPFFPKYRFENGISYWIYDINNINTPIDMLKQDIDYCILGEGGKVLGNHGLWYNVWDGDITSQHPHSAIEEVIFGPKFTQVFHDLVNARVAIKHIDFETAEGLLGGALKPFLKEEMANDLAQALKIVINSIYGLTSAKFSNAFRDPNNIDNIVAKRGALFMTLLWEEVLKRGYEVAHIKTDSIKIPNATDDIKDFVCKFGLEYGYKFETEAEFERFALVNNAVYVAKYKEPKVNKKTGTLIEWTATGEQFAVPYVFKTMFSGEPIEFKDLCETFSVKKGALYLDQNENLPDVTSFETERDKLITKLKKLDENDVRYTEYQNRIDELASLIAPGHDMQFVGRVGQFTPIKSGLNGGVLYRVDNNKNYAASGSTGYRWVESVKIKDEPNAMDMVDIKFYRTLVDNAIAEIGKYGDWDQFRYGDIPTINYNLPWTVACGKDTCENCPQLIQNNNKLICKSGYDISDLQQLNV